MSKGDNIVVYLRYGPPTVTIRATKDGRSVRFKPGQKWGLLEEYGKTGKVTRQVRVSTEAIIAVEEYLKGERQ